MLLLLTACFLTSPPDGGPGDGPGSEPTDGPASPTSPDTSWTVPEGTEPPSFDAAALSEGLDNALAQILGFSADPVQDAYDASMTFEGGSCPYTYSYPYGYGFIEYWYAQCTSPLGATYSGYVSDYWDGAGYRAVYASATILTPDGFTMSGVGYWASSYGMYGPNFYEYHYLDGLLEYDGPEADGTWVSELIQPHQLSIGRNDAGNGSWHTVYVDGQYTGATGPVDTVDFSEVYLNSTYACPEPTGAIALRTPDGDWFDVNFAEGTDPCDGCGLARWRGLEMGEVCGDFTVWTDQ